MATRDEWERRLVAGVDEAGRGPLAGPVVAAAVIVGNRAPEGLDDSKRLSPIRREQLFHSIMRDCTAVSYAVVSPRKIDQVNVLQATLRAMRGAVDGLAYMPDVVHVDGNRQIPGLNISQRTMVRGDARCPSIAAASIVAKVVRDRLMGLWSVAYPQYEFHLHKGYGTRDHVAALAMHGPCPVHRYTFAPVFSHSLFTSSGPSSMIGKNTSK